jgi:carotenoid cleavage oxygenase
MTMAEPRQAPPTTATNPFLSGNFAPVEAETTCFDLVVHGKIPQGLDGRFLRIGPNAIGPVAPLRFHWFLGTGMAHGLRGGRAEWYRSRFVLSAKAAEALSRAPIPGPGAGGRDGEVNTHFTTAAGKLYALVEAGDLQVELDEGLESMARSDFGGTLEAGFAAHPQYDPATGLQHAIVYEPGLPVRYVTLDAAGRADLRPISVDLADSAFGVLRFADHRRGGSRCGGCPYRTGRPGWWFGLPSSDWPT